MNPDRDRRNPPVYADAAPVQGYPSAQPQPPGGYYAGYPAQGYAQPPPPGYGQAPQPGYYAQPPPPQAAYAQPVYVEAVPAHPAYDHQPPVVQGFAHDGPDYGVCRGCGRRFLRHPGVSSATAQYYRCNDCSSPRISDFCVIC